MKRSEVLLREHLHPAQLEDYERTGGFNVRGSDELLYRLNPAQGTGYPALVVQTKRNDSISDCDCYDCRRARSGGAIGFSVWLQGVPRSLNGDWALGMMLQLHNNTGVIYNLACRGYVDTMHMAEFNGGDYGGAI
jgi:hypothetical protein